MHKDSTQAEAALVATLVSRPDFLDEIQLTHDEFLDQDFGLVFRTIEWLHDHGKPVSTVTIIDKLATRVPSPLLVEACDVSNAQPWAIKEFAKIIRDAAMRRRMTRAGQRLIELASNAGEMNDDALAEMEGAIAGVGIAEENGKGPEQIADVTERYLTLLEDRNKNRGRLNGATTGFRELNAYFGGWQPTDLCVVAARPSMGKSALMLQTAYEAAENDEVVVFSIEMGKDSLLDRLTSSASRVPLYSIRNGRMEPQHWPLVTDAISDLEGRHLWFDDNPYATPAYIRSKLRRISRKMPEGRRLVVFVDYLQIIKATRKGRSRAEEVGDISQDLKAIAKELNCCIVALAQLNRSVETRQDKRPTMGDIRDSGQIEQDADVVMFLYRDEYYNPNTERKNVVEVIIGKNRNGPTGTASIVFLKETQRLVDLVPHGASNE